MINTLMQHNEYFRVALYLSCLIALIIGICLPMYVMALIQKVRRYYQNKREMVHFLNIYKKHALPMATLDEEENKPMAMFNEVSNGTTSK